MKKFFVSLIAITALFSPLFASAQVLPRPDPTYVSDWVTIITRISNQAVTFLMVLATLYFIWTVIVYIRSKEAKDAEEKKAAMIRGIIGLVVIVGIWGIVGIITKTFGIRQGSNDTNNVSCPPGMVYSAAARSCI